MKGRLRLGEVVSGRLRRLDAMLGLARPGRSEWVWAIPAAVFAFTAGGFILIGQLTHADAPVVLPNAFVIALVMAGLSVSCMAPAPEDDTPQDDPPGGSDRGPVLGLPGGPWLVVAWPPRGPGGTGPGGGLVPAEPEQAPSAWGARPGVGVERN